MNVSDEDEWTLLQIVEVGCHLDLLLVLEPFPGFQAFDGQYGSLVLKIFDFGSAGFFHPEGFLCVVFEDMCDKVVCSIHLDLLKLRSLVKVDLLLVRFGGSR